MSLFHFHCDVINNGKVTLEDYDVIMCAISRFWKFTPQLYCFNLATVKGMHAGVSYLLGNYFDK